MSNSGRGGVETLLERLRRELSSSRRKGTAVEGLLETVAEYESDQVVEALKELERGGEAVEWNRRWYALRYTDWVVGRLETLRGGRALVRSGERGEAGFSVRRGDLGGARDGDLVLVRPRRKRRGKRDRRRHELPEASVAKILERRFTRLVGRAVPWHSGFRLQPFDPRTRLEVDLRGGLPEGARPGDYVVAELLDSPGRHGLVAARVTEVLGDADRQGVDVRVVLGHFEIPQEFPRSVLDAAARLPDDPASGDTADRLDLTDRIVVTIDGATARDFDDAISVEQTEDGGFELGVHIADVSHYVAEGSPLDREAYRRGTSVYFPDCAVPMLPEALSNGLCSLRPEVPRLTVSACLDIDATGQVRGRSFARSVIRSSRRMTYGEVRRLLEEPRAEDLGEYGAVLPMLQRAERLRELLYQRRLEAGSLDFDLPEVELVLDADGAVENIVPAERSVAHRLIEELMIAANRAVAAELDGAEIPALHRLHAAPELDTMEELRTALAAIGLSFGSSSGGRPSREGLSPESFQAVLRAAAGGPHEALVGSLVLRSMQRAVYSPVEGGHFALSLRHYTHFTSPIRRYPDLLVHRQLKRHIAGEVSAEDLGARLPTIANHSSQTERRAESAERELTKWKKVRFLEDRVGEVFRGTITGVQPFGLFVQLNDYLVDGLVPIRTLSDDYYHFEPDRMRLVGESDDRIFRLGDTIEVLLVAANQEARNLDLEAPGMPPPPARSTGRRRRSVY